MMLHGTLIIDHSGTAYFPKTSVILFTVTRPEMTNAWIETWRRSTFQRWLEADPSKMPTCAEYSKDFATVFYRELLLQVPGVKNASLIDFVFV